MSRRFSTRGFAIALLLLLLTGSKSAAADANSTDKKGLEAIRT